MDIFSVKFAILMVKMFKISDNWSKIRYFAHFKHQITICEHQFNFLGVYLQQKKILMVKVYG